MGVHQIAHGAERNVNVLVQIFVAVVNNVLKYADNLVGDAVDPNAFTDGVLS